MMPVPGMYMVPKHTVRQYTNRYELRQNIFPKESIWGDYERDWKKESKAGVDQNTLSYVKKFFPILSNCVLQTLHIYSSLLS